MHIQAYIDGQWVTVGERLPNGLIMEFGGSIIPDGYLLCDGTPVSRTKYAALFAVISTAFGVGDGATTFNLPDLRGQFVRGVDGSAGVDPDKATRTALKTGGNTGNNIGSAQACATKLPNTPFTISGTTGYDSPAHTHSLPYVPVYNLVCGPPTSTTGAPSAHHTHSIPSLGISGGELETRPTNVYLNYIIKY